ncbi:MAG: hypothetical protein WC712_13620, partial [Candidatus Brocadiia bacterium]
MTYEIVGSADLLSKEDLASLNAKGPWGVTVGVDNSYAGTYGPSISVASAVAAVKPFVPLGIQFNCEVKPDDIVAAHDALPGCKHLSFWKRDGLGAGVLQRICDFRALESLDAKLDTLSDNDIRALGGMSSLRALCLNLPDQGFDAENLYRSLASLQELKYLSLTGSSLDKGVGALLAKLRSLDTIRLYKVRDSDSLLAPTFANCTAKRVFIGEAEGGKQSAFKFTGEEKTVEELTISGIGVTDDLIESLAKLPRLSLLSFIGSDLPIGLPHLPKQIRSLSINRASIPAKWFDAIADLKQLEALCLALDKPCLQDFCSAELPLGLTSLRITAQTHVTEIPSDVISKVASLPKLSNLSLRFFVCRLSPDLFDPLASLTALKDLDVGCEWMKLPVLSRLPNLERFSALEACSVDAT